MNVMELEHLTKDYGNGKGVFDVSFQVKKGEVFGFLGPNGAGKTTTIRHLMGFIRPDRGSIHINGHDCFQNADRIQRILGYLPGEIAFMDDMNGMEFIRFVAGMKQLKDLSRAEELIAFFDLNPSGKIQKMSKGMKQKIGIVCAFMHHPEILILDEPTSGLDPLMQNCFIELILQEKQKGTTILMSSHLFEEVERTCDRTAIIKDGSIVDVTNVEKLRQGKRKLFEIHFTSVNQAAAFTDHYPRCLLSGDSVTVPVSSDVDHFLKTVSQYEVKDIQMQTQTLEELFMHFYGGNQHD